MKRTAPWRQVLGVVAVVVSFLLFRVLDGGWGAVRALWVLAIVMATTWAHRGGALVGVPEQVLRVLQVHGRWMVAALVTLHAAVAGLSAARVVGGAELDMDQGQNTHRATLLLAQGTNPYGLGVLLDGVAFLARRHVREAERLAVMPVEEERATWKRYWDTLNEADHEALLPTERRSATKGADRESRLLGYKYGPLLVLAAAPFTLTMGKVGICALNLACFFLFHLFLWRASRAVRWSHAQSVMFMVMLLCETNLSNNSLFMTASDVCVLAPCALALWGLHACRPMVLALGVALALATKTFPSALVATLLLRPDARAARLPAAAGTLLLMAPWLAWDFQGVVHNLVLWPLAMNADPTSWQPQAPAWFVSAAPVLTVLASSAVVWRLVRAPLAHVPFWLAWLTGLVLVSGSVLHNNYLPWLAYLVFWAWLQGVFGASTGSGSVALEAAHPGQA